MTPEEKDADIKRLTKQIQDNAEKNEINTKTQGTGADAGKIEFSVDDNPIFYIGDNGLYGIEDEDGYSWQNDGVAGNEDFDYPQLDGFYINGGLF